MTGPQMLELLNRYSNQLKITPLNNLRAGHFAEVKKLLELCRSQAQTNELREKIAEIALLIEEKYIKWLECPTEPMFSENVKNSTPPTTQALVRKPTLDEILTDEDRQHLEALYKGREMTTEKQPRTKKDVPLTKEDLRFLKSLRIKADDSES